MRLSLTSLLTTLLLPSWLAASDLPTVKAALPNIAVSKNSAIAPINLQNHFEVTSISNLPGRVVQMRFAYGPSNTTGTVNVEMLPGSAPNSVANFLTYVNGGKYTNTVVHRSVPVSAGKGFGIIQGGSFVSPSMTDVVTDPPIALEYNLPNARGTIAMARQTAPDTATSGWFFNVVDNSTVFGPSNGGGYAAFGRIAGTGMNIVDAIAALRVYVGTSLFGAAFGDFPLAEYANPPGYLDSNAVRLTSASVASVLPSTIAVNVASSSTTTKLVTVTVVPPETSLPPELGIGSTLLGSTVESVVGNFVFLKDNANRTISAVTSVPFTKAGEVSVVTFSVENSNPSLLAATVTGSALEMRLLNNRGGVAALTVKATDSNGNFSQIPFRITVTGGSTAPVDVNGDGFDDFVFQNTAGQIASWFLNGTGNAINLTSGAGLVPGSKILFGGALAGWNIVARGDVNSDGVPDLVFQNTVGQIAAWFLDGSGNALDFATGAGLKPGSKLLYTAGLGDWKIVDLSDINGDGISDLVFQNTVGQIAVWFLDGSGNALDFATLTGLKPGSKLLYAAGLGDWRLVGSADLNGDARNDLVFQDTAGQIAAWFLDGSGNTVDFSNGTGVVPGSKLLYASGNGDWRIMGCPDVNNDGRADLLFQNAAGQIVPWFLDGSGNALNWSVGTGLVSPGQVLISGSILGDWRIR